VENLKFDELLKLKLQAQGLLDLFEQLLRLQGCRLLDVYALRTLLDVGGQGVLFVADDLHHQGTQVVVKMPLVPYHRQAYIDRTSIREARSDLLWEAYCLAAFPGTVLPEIYDYLEDVNPLLDSAWPSEIREHEGYLVMEYISGVSLDHERQVQHSRFPVNFRQIEALAWDVLEQALLLSEKLWSERHWLYTDMRPQNILLAQRDDRRGSAGWRRRFLASEWPLLPCKVDTSIRIVDAGSIANPAGIRRRFPHHPAYLLPDVYQAIQAGQLVTPGPDSVMHALAKSLHQLLTNEEPLPGRTPNWGHSTLDNYSPSLREFLAAMAGAQCATFDEAITLMIDGRRSHEDQRTMP